MNEIIILKNFDKVTLEDLKKLWYHDYDITIKYDYILLKRRKELKPVEEVIV